MPPHNLNAEKSLLGAMLLSKDAIAAAVESCSAEDFYKPAHGHIYEAITALYAQGEPADPLTVSDVLQRSGLLEAIGGLPTLTALQADTPATGNAGRYAQIVEEHALLRRLIGVAGAIAEIGYGVPDDVSAALDRAESLVFEVAERRVTDTMKPLRELLEESLDRLSALYSRQEPITGVPTGFRDLDEQLSGLQPSALLIVGARPAMGKALALDTPIPTPGGWTTMGAVEVGDEVFDESGLPCRVTYRSPLRSGARCYRVSFDDGTAIVADGDHQWMVWEVEQAGPAAEEECLVLVGAPPRAERGIGRDLVPGRRSARVDPGLERVVTTAEMIAGGVVGGDGLPRWYLPATGPLVLPYRDLGDRPFELGRRLAEASDGAEEDLPDGCLRASADQRRALLEGMLEGSRSRLGERASTGGVVVFATELCARRARELSCSLGELPGPIVSVGYGWGFPLGSPTAGSGQGAPSSRRAIVSIVEVPPVDVRCITVDSPHHLYLAGESMLATHNTAFALGMAAHAAMVARVPTLIFSLEMSHSEITQRLLVSEARVPGSRIRNGQLHESDWPKISSAIGRLGEAPLFVDDNPNVTVMEVRAKARRMKARETGLGLIIVDYLQLMTGRSSAENRQVEVSEISRGLKILARELEVPVVALSQLSRTLETRADKRPILADLRESGSLEQDADVVMFLYRDEMYNPDSSDRGTAEVIVAKHRNGPTGKVGLAFLDHYTRFADMARV